MNTVWDFCVDLVAALLSSLSQSMGGSLGAAIILLSLSARVALLPLTLRWAKDARDHKTRLAALKPELERLDARHRRDPERLMRERSVLLQKHGLSLLPRSLWPSALVQLPLFSLLYSAIKKGLVRGGSFLWIRDLALPDAWLVAGVTLMSAAAAWLQPDAAGSALMFSVCVSSAITAYFLWHAASGLALYWGVSTGVGILQARFLRKR